MKTLLHWISNLFSTHDRDGPSLDVEEPDHLRTVPGTERVVPTEATDVGEDTHLPPTEQFRQSGSWVRTHLKLLRFQGRREGT